MKRRRRKSPKPKPAPRRKAKPTPPKRKAKRAPAAKHWVVVACSLAKSDVGFFDGRRFAARSGAVLYPTQGAAAAAGNRLRTRRRDLTIAAAPSDWTAQQLLRAFTGMRRNPAARAAVTEAARRLEAFTGHQARRVVLARQKTVRVGFAMGELVGVAYAAKRDGKTDTYFHKFKKDSRPSLVAAHDGSSLVISGGRYHVTDRGIEDQ